MNNQQIENKIKSSFNNIAPDVLDSVLSDCNTQKGQVIIMQGKKKKNNFVKYMAGLAAALLIILGGLTVYNTKYSIDATIMLDVNPSIEIQVNKKEDVLKVIPLNDDAKTVIGDMNFSGSNLDVTINALIGSMLRNGYISDAANSILVTVANKNAAAGQSMQTKLMTEINTILESGNVSGALLGQTLTNDDKNNQLAEQYGITPGKAMLIEQIIQQNTFYSFENLVPLTINELNLISASGGTKLEHVEAIGKASDAKYIGEQKAKDIALEHAKINHENAERIKCELDWDDGIMIYDVDFDSDGYEYEYEINAKTGAIVNFEKEKDAIQQSKNQKENTSEGSETTQDQSYIDEAEAKAVAFEHAGISETDVSYYFCESDHEHGVVIYEIEFYTNGFEYEYDIDAVTGEVVKYSKEKDDDHSEKSEKQQSDKNKNLIDPDMAKATAINHAGVSDIQNYECEKEFENGKSIYEISFKSGGYEYEYDIDAVTGAIIDYEKEKDN